MNAPRLWAAIAISFACLVPARGIGQPVPVLGPGQATPPLLAPTPPAPRDHRVPPVQDPTPARATSMIESWSLGADARLGLGRFRVMEIARPRTNIERHRDPLNMERETRPIAGAGLSIRFR